MASAEKGNRNSMLRSLGDFLRGVSRYESSENPGSAPEIMRRKQQDKAKGPPTPRQYRPQ